MNSSSSSSSSSSLLTSISAGGANLPKPSVSGGLEAVKDETFKGALPWESGCVLVKNAQIFNKESLLKHEIVLGALISKYQGIFQRKKSDHE